VACANGHRQTVAARPLDEFLRLGRIGQQCLADIVSAVVFDPVELAQLSFHGHTVRLRHCNDTTRCGNVLLKRQMRTVHHH